MRSTERAHGLQIRVISSRFGDISPSSSRGQAAGGGVANIGQTPVEAQAVGLEIHLPVPDPRFHHRGAVLPFQVTATQEDESVSYKPAETRRDQVATVCRVRRTLPALRREPGGVTRRALSCFGAAPPGGNRLRTDLARCCVARLNQPGRVYRVTSRFQTRTTELEVRMGRAH